MDAAPPPRAIAFEGNRLIGVAPIGPLALKIKRVVERGPRGPVQVFDHHTSQPIELDLSGSDADLLDRLAVPPTRRHPGRPKLGVVAREVTLLPRHWDWLARQRGGASVTLRTLVDEARRTGVEADRVHEAQEAAYRFLVAMAGDRPGFEEAARALFAGKQARFNRQVARWPASIQAHAKALAAKAIR